MASSRRRARSSTARRYPRSLLRSNCCGRGKTRQAWVTDPAKFVQGDGRSVAIADILRNSAREPCPVVASYAMRVTARPALEVPAVKLPTLRDDGVMRLALVRHRAGDSPPHRTFLRRGAIVAGTTFNGAIRRCRECVAARTRTTFPEDLLHQAGHARRKTSNNNGWGTRIRTLTGGVRVRCPTVRRSPSFHQ